MAYCFVDESLSSATCTIKEEHSSVIMLDRGNNGVEGLALLHIEEGDARFSLLVFCIDVVVQLVSDERVLDVSSPVALGQWHMRKVT